MKPTKIEASDRPATSNAGFIQGDSVKPAVGGKKTELIPTKSLRYSKGLIKLVNQSAQSEPATATHQDGKSQKRNFLESFMKKKRNATAKPTPPPAPVKTSHDSTPSPTNETKLIKPELITPPSAKSSDESANVRPTTINLHTTTSSTTTPLLSSQSLDQSVSPFKKKQLLEIEKCEKTRRWSESAGTTVNKISSKLKSTVIVDESGKRVHHSTNTSGSSGSSFTEKEDCIEE